jgi:hypothetical protein
MLILFSGLFSEKWNSTKSIDSSCFVPFHKSCLIRFTDVDLEMDDYKALHRNLIDASKRAIITQVSFLQPLPDPENSTFAIVKEKIITDFTGMLILINSFLCKGYLEKIMHLVESGIIENIMSNLKPRIQPKNDDPVALSIDHLLIWFQIWAGCLLTAVLFFLLLMANIARLLIKK